MFLDHYIILVNQPDHSVFWSIFLPFVLGLITYLFTKRAENFVKHRESLVKLQVILILTDIHGELNKTPKEVINSYYHAIERLAMNYRFTIVYLSDLWKKYNISLKDLTLSLSNEKNSPEQFLISAAKKHYHGKDFLTGAKLYKLCSSYDSKIICKEFPYSFFATYNGALWKPILPSLPTISFWSERRGFHSKPWHSSPIPV